MSSCAPTDLFQEFNQARPDAMDIADRVAADLSATAQWWAEESMEHPAPWLMAGQDFARLALCAPKSALWLSKLLLESAPSATAWKIDDQPITGAAKQMARTLEAFHWWSLSKNKAEPFLPGFRLMHIDPVTFPIESHWNFKLVGNLSDTPVSAALNLILGDMGDTGRVEPRGSWSHGLIDGMDADQACQFLASNWGLKATPRNQEELNLIGKAFERFELGISTSLESDVPSKKSLRI